MRLNTATPPTFLNSSIYLPKGILPVYAAHVNVFSTAERFSLSAGAVFLNGDDDKQLSVFDSLGITGP